MLNVQDDLGIVVPILEGQVISEGLQLVPTLNQVYDVFIELLLKRGILFNCHYDGSHLKTMVRAGSVINEGKDSTARSTFNLTWKVCRKNRKKLGTYQVRKYKKIPLCICRTSIASAMKPYFME